MNSPMNKRIFIFIVLVISFSILYQGLFAISYAEEKFEIDVKLGFDGYVIQNEITTVKIEIKNNSKDIDGKIQLLVQNKINQKNFYTAYSKKINIVKGATKVIDMESTFYENGNLFVRIVDKRNNIIFEKNVKYLSLKKPDDLYMGILSENIDSLRYLATTYDKRNYNGSNKSYFSIVELDENIPENYKALKMLKVIIINNYNLELLNKNQQEALRKWAESGGMILIGTGPNYQKLVKGLEGIDFLDIHGTIDKDIPELGWEKPIKLINTDLKEGEEIIVDGMGKLPFYHKEMGKGHIIIASFDLGLSPFGNWKENDEFINEVINKYLDTEISNYLNQNFKMQSHFFNNIVSYLPNNLLPSIKAIIAILVLFILLVGPINYIILKRLDKREFIWITIPLIVILFSSSIYILGFKTRLRQPIMNNISIINIDEEDKTAEISTKTGLMGFENNDWDIVFDKESEALVEDTNKNDVLQRFADGEIVTEYMLDNERHIILNKAGVLDVKTVVLNEEINLQDIVYTDFRVRDGKILGEIKNLTNFDLEDTVIFYGDSFQKLGDLKSGESLNEISLDISNISTNGSFRKDWYVAIDKLYGMQRVHSSKHKDNILNNNIKRDILEDLFRLNQDLISKNRFFMITWNKEELGSKVKINDREVKRLDRNLILIPLNIKYEKGQRVTVPYGVVYPQVVDINNMEIDEYDLEINGDGYVVFGFRPQESMELINMQMDLEINSSKSRYEIYVYNFTENIWESIDEEEFEVDTVNKDKYYKENTGTLIKIDANKDIAVDFPSFKIEGVIK